MTWFKLDDQFDDHPKFVGLPDSALAVWVRGLAYCSRHGTDGYISWQVAGKLVAGGRRTRVIQYLLDRAIWEPVEGGYQVHDYTDHQRSKAEIERIRAEARERKARRVRANSQRTSRDGSRDVRLTETETETETDHHQRVTESEARSDSPPDDDDDESRVILDHVRRWALANGKTNPVGYARSVIDNHAGEFDGIDGVELIQALDDRWPLNPTPRNGTAPTGAVDLGGGDIFLPGSGIVSTGEPERSLSAVAQAALREMGA